MHGTITAFSPWRFAEGSKPARRNVIATLLIGALLAGMGAVGVINPASSASAASGTADSSTWCSLINWRSRGAVEIAEASKVSGAPVVQQKSTKSASQQFQFVSVGGGYFEITSRNSSLVLTINASSGSLAMQTARTGAKAQQFPSQRDPQGV